MKFLTNPKRKARRKTRFKKGSAAAKRFMASIRPKSKGGGTVAKRKSRKRVSTRKRRTYRRNPTRSVSVRRRRSVHRRYRRNPGGLKLGYFSVNTLMNGVIDSVEVVVGKAAARAVPNMVGLDTSGPLGLAWQGLSALAVGWVGHSFISVNAGKMMLAGGLAAPLESFIKSMNIPFISANLGEDTVEIEGVGAYPQISGMGAYPQASPVGETEYEYANQQ